MNILFLHRNFPGQFKNLINQLLKDLSNEITFVTSNSDVEIEGVEKIVYEPRLNNSTDEYLKFYSEAVSHGEAVAEKLQEFKNKGFLPDIIYAHSWGPMMFVKDIFPNVPLIGYFEWFYNSEGADFGYLKNDIKIEEKQALRCKNASTLIDLCNCDMGITPTQWQKSQFPNEFQGKLKVIHDGIDTEICRPDEKAEFFIKDKGLTLTSKDEVITYATRGMEMYRGFPNFMKAVEILLKKRPNAQFVIAGHDEVFYGMKIEGKTYKQVILEQFDIDLERVHFVDFLPYDEYIKLLQISSAHVYLTVPFVLSWSLLEAMSCGCCVVASSTQPVLEVLKDGQNGLLFDFFNVGQMLQQIEFALDNPEHILKIRQNARTFVSDNLSSEIVMPLHLKMVSDLLNKT